MRILVLSQNSTALLLPSGIVRIIAAISRYVTCGTGIIRRNRIRSGIQNLANIQIRVLTIPVNATTESRHVRLQYGTAHMDIVL